VSPRAIPDTQIEPMIPFLTTVVLSAAHAATVGDHVSDARSKLSSGDYAGAEAALIAAETLAPETGAVVPTVDLARIGFYRGVLAQLRGLPPAEQMAHWRGALVIAPELAWDGSLVKPESETIFLALRTEVRDRAKIDIGAPEATGAAVLYLDGVRVRAGDTALKGTHLAQVACPSGVVPGRWTDFERPLKWLKLCPEKVDTTVVVEEKTDDWATFGAFGPAADQPEMVTPAVSALDDRPAVVRDVPAEALVATLLEAATAFESQDAAALGGAHATANGQIVRLSEVVNPRAAAAYHRLGGMVAWTAGDRDGTVRALRAALVIDPNMDMPRVLLDQSLAEAVEEARGLGAGGTLSLTIPEGLSAWVDGAAASERSDTFPSIVQVAGPDDTVYWSGVLAGEGRNPNWKAEGVYPILTPVDEPTLLDRTSRPLLIAAGASALVSAVSYGVAASSAKAYHDTSNPDVSTMDDLDKLRRRANTGVVLSAGMGLAAVGLGVSAFVVIGG